MSGSTEVTLNNSKSVSNSIKNQSTVTTSSTDSLKNRTIKVLKKTAIASTALTTIAALGFLLTMAVPVPIAIATVLTGVAIGVAIAVSLAVLSKLLSNRAQKGNPQALQRQQIQAPVLINDSNSKGALEDSKARKENDLKGCVQRLTFTEVRALYRLKDIRAKVNELDVEADNERDRYKRETINQQQDAIITKYDEIIRKNANILVLKENAMELIAGEAEANPNGLYTDYEMAALEMLINWVPDDKKDYEPIAPASPNTSPREPSPTSSSPRGGSPTWDALLDDLGIEK